MVKHIEATSNELVTVQDVVQRSFNSGRCRHQTRIAFLTLKVLREYLSFNPKKNLTHFSIVFLQFCQTVMIVSTNQHSSAQLITVFSKKIWKLFATNPKDL